MNHPDDPLDPYEDALARALHAEAEAVRPVGDGLVRIRSRVERRRLRNRWLVPGASVAAVAATVTAVVASGALTGSRQTPSVSALGGATLTSSSTPDVTTVATTAALPSRVSAPVTQAPKVMPSVAAPVRTTAAPAPSTTTEASVVSSDVQPVRQTPVWPFSSTTDAAGWQKEVPAGNAWHLDAVQTAEHFVDSLSLKGVTLAGKPVVTYTDGQYSATVVLQRKGDAETPVTFATVSLSHWGSGKNAPWGIVSVTSSTLTVTEDAVGGPLTVSAPGTSEGQLSAAVYPAGSPVADTTVAVPSSGTLPLPTDGSSGAGFVVVANVVGGGSTPTVGGLAVVPVQLAGGSAAPSSTAPASSATTSTAPTSTATSYVAVVGGRIEVLDAATGTVRRSLAPGVTGVTSVSVTQDGAWVWYATPQGVFKTLTAAPSQPVLVSSTPATYVSVAGAANQSWASTYISPTGGAQNITWTARGTTGTIPISQSLPPEADTLAISPDGTQVSYWLRSGTAGQQLTVPTSTTYHQSRYPTQCSDTVPCAGATYTANGDLVIATTDGSHVTVWRDTKTKATKLFTVAASAQTYELDVDASGSQVLMVARGGGGWLFDGSKTTALPAGIAYASW